MGGIYQKSSRKYSWPKPLGKYKIDCVTNKTTPTDDGFLTIVAREYYQFIGSTTRRFDPKTLIFGERYAMSRVPMNVLAEALPYIDVV